MVGASRLQCGRQLLPESGRSGALSKSLAGSAVRGWAPSATRPSLLHKVKRKTHALVTSAIVDQMTHLRPLVHTVTFDNGLEFAGHQVIAKCLRAATYFARPYHSWERGLNENTNERERGSMQDLLCAG